MVLEGTIEEGTQSKSRFPAVTLMYYGGSKLNQSMIIENFQWKTTKTKNHLDVRSIDLLARDENRHSDTNGMHHARPSLEMDGTLNFDVYRLGSHIWAPGNMNFLRS